MNAPLALPDRQHNRTIARLNSRWQVVDGPPHWPGQWVLARKKGSPRPGRTGWIGSSYHTDPNTLARDIRERCGPVAAEGLAAIRALPPKHPRSK